MNENTIDETAGGNIPKDLPKKIPNTTEKQTKQKTNALSI